MTIALVATCTGMSFEAWALHPEASCNGVAAAGQVAQPSFVRAQATLQRIDGATIVDVENAELQGWTAGGDVLLAAAWAWPPVDGVYRVRLDSIVYDGVETAAPPENLLAGWPAARRFALSMTSTPFTCAAGEPRIWSMPPTTVAASEAFSYSPAVVYAGPGVLRYTVVAGPAGLIFDEISGAFVWPATPSRPLRAAVILRVEDEATQRFAVQAFVLTTGGS